MIYQFDPDFPAEALQIQSRGDIAGTGCRGAGRMVVRKDQAGRIHSEGGANQLPEFQCRRFGQPGGNRFAPGQPSCLVEEEGMHEFILPAAIELEKIGQELGRFRDDPSQFRQRRMKGSLVRTECDLPAASQFGLQFGSSPFSRTRARCRYVAIAKTGIDA